jgi:hypothetical protein
MRRESCSRCGGSLYRERRAGPPSVSLLELPQGVVALNTDGGTMQEPCFPVLTIHASVRLLSSDTRSKKTCPIPRPGRIRYACLFSEDVDIVAEVIQPTPRVSSPQLWSSAYPPTSLPTSRPPTVGSPHAPIPRTFFPCNPHPER